MRRVLVVDKVDNAAKELAEQLSCPEIACNVPRFEGYVTFLPCVIIESGTNPGIILAAFPIDRVEDIEDLPEPEKIIGLATVVETLQQSITTLEQQVAELQGNV